MQGGGLGVSPAADLLSALLWLVELQVVLLPSPPELALLLGICYFLKQACLQDTLSQAGSEGREVFAARSPQSEHGAREGQPAPLTPTLKACALEN